MGKFQLDEKWLEISNFGMLIQQKRGLKHMTLSDYANKKYSKGKERDSIYRRWNGFDLDSTPVDFFKNFILNQNPSNICHGFELLAELEIREAKLEEEVLDYCRQIMDDPDFNLCQSGKSDIFESILWSLGDIGSVESLEFLQDLIYNEIDKFKKFGNLEHILSACQYSFYQINKREVANFFFSIRSIRDIPVKTQAEIDDLRKLNPKYAEFQQFLLDNYKKYEGGIMN